MRIIRIEYARKFGGARGSKIEEYGSEGITLEATAEDGEDLDFDTAFEECLDMKRVAYKVHSPPKKEEAGK
jgi:hypothetical protein